jgi:hypothetical protein
MVGTVQSNLEPPDGFAADAVANVDANLPLDVEILGVEAAVPAAPRLPFAPGPGSFTNGPSTTMNLWRSPGKAHHRQRSSFYVWFLLLSLVLAVATIWQSSRLFWPASDDPPSSSLWVPSRRNVSKDLTTGISTTTILGDTTERAIFFDIFVPNDNKNKQNALSIVQQQLSKKRSTSLIAHLPVY